jgi:hypothetical protein
MQSKQIFLLLFLLCTYYFLPAQRIDFNEYSPLVSQGDIPDDFLLMGSDLYERELSEYEEAENRFDRKSEKRFLLQSSYIINEILHSGRILYNDPVSQYVNKVVDNLLKDNPDLRKEIRVYLTKSPSVNAFSTDEGIIFINVGIVAQLSNEAELAYILAHEIVHYVEKHNMEMYVESERVFRGKNYKYLSLDDKYLATTYRSKESENEADEKGLLDFYAKSDYSLDAVLGVFDVLQYSYLPFDEIPFEKSFFETDHIVFPEDWFPEEINAIKVEDDYDDSKSTHPNTRKRKDALRRLLENMDDDGKMFIQVEEDFYYARNVARFEAIRQQVLLHEYGDAIYNSYILLKEFPGNKYLQKSIAASLYGATKYKLHARIRDVIPYEDKVEGQSYKLFYFLNQLSGKEWNTLALQYCWDIHKQFPDDVYIRKLCEDLFLEMVESSKLEYYDFSSKSKEIKQKEFEEEQKEADEKDEKQSTKYSRIKKQREKESFKDDEWVTYAFVDYMKDEEFTTAFRKAMENAEDDTEEEEEDYDSYADKLKEERKKERYERKYGKALGIDRLVLIDPLYLSVDQRKDDNVKYLDSEKNLQVFYNQIDQCAKAAGLELEMISVKNMGHGDTEKYNDLSLIKEWMAERFEIETKEMVLADYEPLQRIADKYDAEHIAWTGVMQMKSGRDNVGTVLCYSLMLPVLLPVSLYMAVTPEVRTYFYFAMFNVSTGEVKFVVDETMYAKAQNSFLKSKLFDIFQQIKKEPRNEN